ncbi:MAG: adenylate/guanylate cyclase domain-containing protein [Planctomycetaceae bacterium]
MYYLIAQGPDPRQRWRQQLHFGGEYVLGRSTEADFPVPWEKYLSKRHAKLKVDHLQVTVELLPGVGNPLFVDGEAVNRRTLSQGERFVVGETMFLVDESTADSSSLSNHQQLEERTFSHQELERVRFRDADWRIEVLSRLPQVIAAAHGEDELESGLAQVLLAGIRQADAVAIVECREDGDVVVTQWERRRETEGVFRPSSRLVSEALLVRKMSLLHVWSGSEATRADYTVNQELDWAFCTPISAKENRRWGIYVAGRLERGTGPSLERSGEPYLDSDVKFAELVAAMIRSVQHVQHLQGNLSVLRQFLSSPIVAALERSSGGAELDTSLLEPRECDVTVLFCDLRGFSQRAEESSADLKGLLGRVSGALEVMTQCILDHGGVTGDFLGDATLGFWGWPFASEESPLNACRAALRIRQRFDALKTDSQHPLYDFEVGIGIAHGRAVAGKIGTSDRVTVTVFGPVVNLASRLEGLTKQLHVPILLDEAMTAIVSSRLSETEGRTRRLARLLPYGTETPITVAELLPPVGAEGALTLEELKRYEEGVDHFIAGRWEQAYRCLHAMPSSDRAQDFLTMRIVQHNRSAPSNWDGIIRMPSK